MKGNKTAAIVVVIFVVLTIPIQLAAQDGQARHESTIDTSSLTWEHSEAPRAISNLGRLPQPSRLAASLTAEELLPDGRTRQLPIRSLRSASLRTVSSPMHSNGTRVH